MKYPFCSQSVSDLRFSVIREMSLLATHMDDVINLGIGEPDFTTPDIIIEKAFADARNGHTHYTASQGDPQLLHKLSQRISKTIGTDIPASSILVTHGGMGALASALKTILNTGDQVLLVEPHFPDYHAHVILAGGQAIGVPTSFEEHYIPRPETVERMVTENTRVIILNSPNNPTGAVIPGDVLDALAEIAIRRNLFIISDEVYDQLVYDPPFESIYTRPGMAERTLVIKSFSKSHAMTGWRVGYCYGPADFIRQMLKVVNYSTACTSSIGQRAALAALDLDPALIDGMKDRFDKRIGIVCSRLEAMQGVRVNRPKGSFYILADRRGVARESQKFAKRLLQEAQVVVVPGYAFGKAGEGTIRIACTHPGAILSEAMDRIELFLERYQ